MKKPVESYFVPTILPNTNMPIIVTEVGETHWIAGQSTERRISDILALELIISGTVYLRQGKEEFRIQQNEIMVLKRGVKHFYEAQSEVVTKLYFGLDGEIAEIFIERLNSRIRPLQPGVLLTRFREIIAVALAKPANFPQRLSELAYSVLLDLLICQEHSKGRRLNIEGTLLHALQFMQDNIKREIMVEEIARHCCISMPHLHSLFRSRLHISPIRHFHAQKVKVAQHLLRSTNLSCKEISISLGFVDQLHFSRLFKNECGVSPAKYRVTMNNTKKDSAVAYLEPA